MIQAQCTYVNASPGSWMSLIPDEDLTSSSILCGKTGGDPFSNVNRADQNGTCPIGLEACIADASPENVLCYSPSKIGNSCAITDIKVVPTANIGDNQYTNYTDVGAWNETYHIMYSKTYDSRPVTTFRMEVEPCISPYDQSQTSSQQFYPAELIDSDMKCAEDTYTGFTNDERFTNVGVYSTLGNM